MLTVLVWSIAILAVPVFVAAAMLFVELVAAQLPAHREADDPTPRPSCAVLIPAHNEEAGIGPTLASIIPQLAPGDRVLVVADNCTDATAAVARAAGAEVVERADTARRGKGYALDFGVRTLEKAPPAVAVIIDADCTLEPGSLDRLVRKSAASDRPVQAAYFMEAPHDGGARSQLAAFLFALKNVIRPRGLARLGLPCLLTGTGMAFPWELLRRAPLASGNIVEDMQLGIDLALAGRPPLYCGAARVRSELPATSGAAASQRTRWIHGHLTTLTTQAHRLLAAAVRRGRPVLLGLALEVGVPPLSLLVLAGLLASTVLTVGALLGGPALPALIAVSGGVLMASALLLTWARFGRAYLPAADLLTIPGELVSRLFILFRFVTRPQGTWIRTERRTSS
jgi:cellulose synthase/poly-beta-1,6-N-acetylglucosamine synthase-like glycosyltransferase